MKALSDMLTIIYMAKLKELLATDEEQIPWESGKVSDLIALLRQRNSTWEAALSQKNIYKIAINNKIVHGDADIPANAEVAILPPVTGG